MAFDLKGTSPQEYSGEWIRFNIWMWPRVWKASTELVPNLLDIKLWYLNANELVNEKTCIELADQIERYGVDNFASKISRMDLPVPNKHLDKQTIYGTYVFEIEEFVLFLRSCGGFYIQ